MRTSFFILILSFVLIASGFHNEIHASTKSPFLELAGNWKGKGRVNPRDGQPERISCRVRYNVRSNGIKITQNINCAGSGYWIKAKTNFNYVPGSRRISGTWSASYGDKSDPEKRSTNGKISGSYINDVIAVSLDSNDYNGEMTIRMNGRKQEVAIGKIAKIELTR